MGSYRKRAMLPSALPKASARSSMSHLASVGIPLVQYSWEQSSQERNNH